jgi:hypothetical protein
MNNGECLTAVIIVAEMPLHHFIIAPTLDTQGSWTLNECRKDPIELNFGIWIQEA